MYVYSGSTHHFQCALSSNSVKLKLFVHCTFKNVVDCWYAMEQKVFFFCDCPLSVYGWWLATAKTSRYRLKIDRLRFYLIQCVCMLVTEGEGAEWFWVIWEGGGGWVQAGGLHSWHNLLSTGCE